MKTNRTGITRLTSSQCSRIVGGDPGMVLAGGGNGNGSGGVGIALAGMGVGIEGGPMAVVTIGLPAETPLSGFDKSLIGSVGGASGAAAGAFFTGFLTGAEMGVVAGPVGILAAGVVGGLVTYGATLLLQHAANETAYAGHVRRAIP